MNYSIRSVKAVRKHKYLNRVSATILTLVFIPLVIIAIFFWRRANIELENSNEAYYAQVVNSFAGDFEERLASLQEHAISIVVDSKVDKSVFHEGMKNAAQHPYWYYRAVHEMQDLYFHYNASQCGIYYYDADRAVTLTGSSPPMYFLAALDIRDPAHDAWSFFDPERYSSGSWIFSSTYTTPDKNAYVLAGYCTEIGKNRDKAMVFYTLSRDDYVGLQTVVYEQSGINFLIRDENREDVYMFIGDSTAAAGTPYVCASDWLPLTYEIQVTNNALADNTDTFYKDTSLILVALMVVLAVTCVVSIAIVYRPVFSITTELGKRSRETDEFGSIRNAIGERNAKIMEQENLILDLLLKHLIHGVPISQKAMSRLGVGKNMDHYCVFVLDGCVLPASEAKKLAEKIESELSVRLFYTDLQGENKIILILFQRGPDTNGTVNVLSQWLCNYTGGRYTLTVGSTVSRLDDIRCSFLSCLEQISERTQDAKPIKEEITSLADREKQQKDLEMRILEHLKVSFRDPDLSQVKVADMFKISTYSLSRLFKNQVGIGFAEYVNSKRLEYARDLLLTTSLSIREVALQSGYASESYFGRLFKATYGTSPSAFREQ